MNTIVLLSLKVFWYDVQGDRPATIAFRVWIKDNPFLGSRVVVEHWRNVAVGHPIVLWPTLVSMDGSKLITLKKNLGHWALCLVLPGWSSKAARPLPPAAEKEAPKDPNDSRELRQPIVPSGRRRWCPTWFRTQPVSYRVLAFLALIRVHVLGGHWMYPFLNWPQKKSNRLKSVYIK